MQPLNPLTVVAIGLGPALDLPREGRRGRHHVEAGFEQGEEQDVAGAAAGTVFPEVSDAY